MSEASAAGLGTEPPSRSENAVRIATTPAHDCAEWEAEYGLMRDALIRVAWFAPLNSDAYKDARAALQRRDLRYPPASRPSA